MQERSCGFSETNKRHLEERNIAKRLEEKCSGSAIQEKRKGIGRKLPRNIFAVHGVQNLCGDIEMQVRRKGRRKRAGSRKSGRV